MVVEMTKTLGHGFLLTESDLQRLVRTVSEQLQNQLGETPVKLEGSLAPLSANQNALSAGPFSCSQLREARVVERKPRPAAAKWGKQEGGERG